MRAVGANCGACSAVVRGARCRWECAVLGSAALYVPTAALHTRLATARSNGPPASMIRPTGRVGAAGTGKEQQRKLDREGVT